MTTSRTRRTPLLIAGGLLAGLLTLTACGSTDTDPSPW